MGIFSKPEIIILKESNSAEEHLAKLEELLPRATGKVKENIQKEIILTKAGIDGEKKVLYELKNSNMDLVVLQDICIRAKDGREAQIDFVIVTSKLMILLECKNLVGNIEIDSKGNFIRTIQYGKRYWKEGIYSPITQNERHMEVLKRCNELCALFEKNVENKETKVKKNGVIVYSDLLLEYLKKNYPGLYFVSSTTKVLTDFEQFLNEVNRKDFQYVVPDFRLNKSFDKLNTLSQMQKDKVEFLCNECCWFDCKDRKRCYEAVSRKNLGENSLEHHCTAPDINHGYRFSKAMTNPGFIGIDAIQNIYLPMGFSNFKIEGRSLGSALILEFLLYYMTKPEYQLHVREEIYLDNMLDLF